MALVRNCVLFPDLYFTLFFTPLLTNHIVHGPVSDLFIPPKVMLNTTFPLSPGLPLPPPMQVLPLTMLPNTTSCTWHSTAHLSLQTPRFTTQLSGPISASQTIHTLS